MVVRQKYAKKMLELLDQDLVILNIDQSWLNQMDFRRRKWCIRGQRNSVAFRTVQPRLSVLCAIDTNGSVYLALTQCHTDSEIICLFIKELLA